MTDRRLLLPVALLAALASAACGSSRSSASVQPVSGRAPTVSPAEQARADGGIQRYGEADVQFASGMIAHHAQAIVMSRWCESHGAGASLKVLCERIVIAQGDEIAIMQRWLRERSLPVPEPDPRGLFMPSMNHHMLMPGMLSAEQMARLEAARGVEFERLFLTCMIQHHEGAIAMVEQLLGSVDAANDVLIYKIASDVYADQTTEIERMTRMLNALPPGGR